ncbi:MAG: acyl-CoA thioesterase [Steroidobacteraceae bacterium]
MNRWLRLLWFALTVRRRAVVGPLGPCRTPFRVWPSDLDVFRHMNNGIYLTIMDIARLDLLTRSGLWTKLRALGWYPVVVAQTAQFRRSLNLFERFEIETRVLGWDDKAIVLEQQFWRGGEAIAHALVRARILKAAGGQVTPQELALAAGYDPQSPPLSGYAASWNAEQATWKGQKRSEST